MLLQLPFVVCELVGVYGGVRGCTGSRRTVFEGWRGEGIGGMAATERKVAVVGSHCPAIKMVEVVAALSWLSFARGSVM